MANNANGNNNMGEARALVEQEENVRFEDLTVDDDLPILERIVHYTSSQIALQRLVHVKMLAETAELAGPEATTTVLIPLLEPLLNDSEAVIRQHIAGQLLAVTIVAMRGNHHEMSVQEILDHPESLQVQVEDHELVLTMVVSYLKELIADPEADVRRAAADSLSGLALLCPTLVSSLIIPIAEYLAQQKPATPSQGKKRTEQEQRMEELRITACNLLAELGGAASEHLQIPSDWMETAVVPLLLEMCRDDSFRVRRSAAQALPRVLGACGGIHVAREQILPAFCTLSQDEVHRVRKSTGECLVDMSRALMILVQACPDQAEDLYEMRRTVLLPVADRLIQDSHKQVRQGMMQFLGPFMASFYPYQYSPLHTLLPTTVESDGSHHLGIVAQFFPHASSMVARLNASQNAIATTPTPVHKSLEVFCPPNLSDQDRLQRALPTFIHAARMSALSLAAVARHRREHPPNEADLKSLTSTLLDYFAALSVVSTGDENTDAEMRVYCAYSFPALVLLLGPENWAGSMQTCFFTLLNPNHGQDDAPQNKDADDVPEPPLPVKRCLASSLHTVAHVLGPELAAQDVIPVVQEYFLRDTDDSVRLNMIRNFPALLSALPESSRAELLAVWSQVIQGEGFLGGRKRSATNPLVLNWRQRDYLARTLPDIIELTEPSLLHNHVWPILKILLGDSINDVRDDALWSVAVLLKAYCADTCAQKWNVSEPKKFGAEKTALVLEWVLENILGTPKQGKPGSNFTDRQLYCRICGSLGLALRLSEDLSAEEPKDPVSVLSEKFKSLFYKNDETNEAVNGPYQKMTPAEQKHVKKILVEDLLPHALKMKEDRISNVRITLMRVLQILPFDIRTSAKVKPVLRELEEENETWTSFGEEMTSQADEQVASTMTDRHPVVDTSSGPVDVDNVSITPASSRDEEDEPKKAPKAQSLMSSGFHHEPGEQLRTVVFEDGPIGMQLEPTVNDKACRIYDFNDFGPDKVSPALASGKIRIGDVIVSVNGVMVKSYDETISLLKAGGRRKVCFRQGTEEDALSDGGAGTSGDEDDEERRRDRKARKKAKKHKKEGKKHHKSSDDASVEPDEDHARKKSDDGSDDDEEVKKKKAKEAKKAKKAKKESKKGKKSKDED